MIITELSPTVNGTGIPNETGSVAESLLTAVFQTQERCLNPKVYRLDRASGSLSIIDETSLAISATANSFTPFNSDGDEFSVNCEEDFQAILFRLDTQGNHSATLKVKDSTNGSWATNELTVTDDSNAFEAATGWHYITIPDNAQRTAFKLSNDPTLNTPAGKYILFRLDGIVSGNTMPKISNLTLIRKNFRFDSHTTSANGDVTTAPAQSTNYPYPGSNLMLGFDNPAYGAELYISLAVANVITDTHEYLATDGTWKILSGWTNASNDFTAGPTVLGNPIEKFAVRFTIPSDWTARSQTITLDDGTTTTVSAFWIRERTVSVLAYGPHIQPRWRARGRAFGNANTTGLEVLVATTLRGLRLQSATIPNTADILGEIANMSTGKASSFTIPANPVFPLNIDTADLTINAGERYSLIAKSGGTARNIQLEVL